MELVEISKCKSDILPLLRPRQHLPLFSMAFDNRLVYLASAHSSDLNEPLLAYQNTKILSLMKLSSDRKLEIFNAIYPDLGVFELLRVHLNSPGLFEQKDIEKHLHTGSKADDQAFFNGLVKLPLLLQNHLDSKKVRFSEIAFLRAWDFEVNKNVESALLKIVEFNFSLQQSLKAIEMLTDLMLLKREETNLNSSGTHSTKVELRESSSEASLFQSNDLPSDSLELLAGSLTETAFFTTLSTARYPISNQIEQNRKQQMQSISWPAFAKAKTVRRGDRTGYEVQAFLSSESDLIKLISTMERVKDEFKKSPVGELS